MKTIRLTLPMRRQIGTPSDQIIPATKGRHMNRLLSRVRGIFIDEAVALTLGLLSIVGCGSNSYVTPAPTIFPASGTYSSPQAISLSDSLSAFDGTIYFTIDGTTPTTASQVYSGPITGPFPLSQTETVKAIAVTRAYGSSPVSSATYTSTLPAAPTPTFSPAGGNHVGTQVVTILDSLVGSSIYYTTDGSAPSIFSTMYTAPITVAVNTTIQAVAFETGYSQSPVASAAFVIQVATPAITPAAGTYTSAQVVTITDSTPGAVIHYTTDGSTPTASSATYNGPLSVTQNETVQAIAVEPGLGNSAVSSSVYVIAYPTATPVISPTGGTYSTTQNVTITDSSPGAVIYYTTDGVTPTPTSSIYDPSMPIQVVQSETVQALALAPNFSVSGVASQTYTLNLPQVPTPTFSPVGGTYSTAQTVTINDSLSGATIHYTTDGTTATTNSPVYDSAKPLLITSSTKISALATEIGYNPSAVASSTYFISATTSLLTGRVLTGTVSVYNSTINLYSAGTMGYGAGATLLATTVTDTNGNFTFTKLANGAGIAGGGANWSCPASDPNPDPQIYITAVGGNTQGTGVATTSNGAAAFLAAIGPCSAVSSSTQVQMNELTTVATVFALGQYINPGNGSGQAMIGTNGANTSTNTPQGAVGLNNAVAGIVNLANLSTGTAVTQNSYKGTNATTVATTVIATPETAKLTTVANALAACINTTDPGSIQCLDLFASASASPVSSVTSQPAAAFVKAQDTIQAAYYMATNPTNAGTFTMCSTSSAPNQTGCLFNLATTSPTYTGGLTAAPLDWTIGIAYTTATGSTCASGEAFISSPYRSAVDAYGNLWFVGSNSTSTVSVSAMSPIGLPLFCAAAVTPAGANQSGLTIDTAGDIWASFDYKPASSTTGGQIYEIPTPGAVPTTAAMSSFTSGQLASGQTLPPFSIVGDAYGNVFYATATSSGTNVYEIPAGTTNASTTVSSLIGTTTAVTTSQAFWRAADSVGRVYFVTNAAQGQTIEVTPPSAAISSYSINGGSVTFTATNSFTVGQKVLISGLTSPEGLLLDRQQLTLTAATPGNFTAFTSVADTSGAVSDAGIGVVVPTGPSSYSLIVNKLSYGLFGAAIDNESYLYAATTYGSATGNGELIKATINPAGTAINDAANNNYSFSAPYIGGLNGARAVTLDGADNVWFGNPLPSADAASGESPTAGTWSVGELYTTGEGGSTAKFFALSPVAPGLPTGDTCSASAGCPVGGGFQKSSLGYSSDMSIDPSGNVWTLDIGVSSAVDGGTSITELVGAAVPTVTPLAVAAAHGALATKP